MPYTKPVETMLHFLMHVHGSLLVIVCFFGALGVEMLLYPSRGLAIHRSQILGNVASALIGIAVQPVAALGYVFAYQYIYNHYRLWTIPTNVGTTFLILILWDFGHYVQHRMGHRVGILWASHSVHHSATTYDVSIAPRKFWFWALGFEPIYVITFPFLGISILQLAIISVIINLLSFFHHTRTIGRIPLLDLFLVTPSNHRVHHGVQSKYVDVNYAHIFIIFDKMFKTYQKEEEEPIYGYVGARESANPFVFQFSGFVELFGRIREAHTIREAIAYLYKPPGWTPRKTAGVHSPSPSSNLQQP